METSRHRSFVVGEDAGPVTFDINGETFTCKSIIPGTTLLRYVQMFTGLYPGASIEATLQFFGDVMEPEEHDRFIAYVESPDTTVPSQLFGPIVEFLLEEYGARPFGKSSSEEPGQSQTAQPSTAG